MNALLVVVAAAAMGIEVGWEPLPGGGHEYTIQLEPQLLQVLEKGQDEVFSEVPEGIEVRRYRIVVGVGKLRRDAGPLAAELNNPLATSPATSSPSPAKQPPIYEAPPATAPKADPQAAPYERDPIATRPEDPSGAGSALDFGAPPRDQAPPDFGSNHTTAPAAEPTNPYGDPPVKSGTTPDLNLPATAPEIPAAEEATRPAAQVPAASEPVDPWSEYGDKPDPSASVKPSAETPSPSDLVPVPKKLPESVASSEPIQKTTFEDAKNSPLAEEVEAAKPEIDELPSNEAWMPLLTTVFLLACSLGLNIYLGLILRDARARYRNVVAKFRGAPA